VAESHWQSICQVIGREDLLEDANYSAAYLRKKRQDEIDDMIEAWSSTLPRDEAFHAMRDAKIPVAPVRDLEEVRTDPHLHERGMLNWMTHPQMGEIVLPSSPIRYSEYDRHEVVFFPEPGADNTSVYGDQLGLDEKELDSLRVAGVI
jgi:crotonobetainyl-CoA:carnitine CoA-transferase CaiB-like acyl-CoA transferase